MLLWIWIIAWAAIALFLAWCGRPTPGGVNANAILFVPAAIAAMFSFCGGVVWLFFHIMSKM